VDSNSAPRPKNGSSAIDAAAAIKKGLNMSLLKNRMKKKELVFSSTVKAIVSKKLSGLLSDLWMNTKFLSMILI